MDTPDLHNGSLAQVDLAPQIGMDGGLLMVVMVKQKFAVSEKGEVAAIDGAENRFSDEFWDEENPETSSIKYPADLCIRKPSTDVVVVGSAMQRDRALAKKIDVLVRVGPMEQALAVHGPRVWYEGMRGLTLSPAEPFESLPVQWEHAFGGYDDSVPDKPIENARNPIGCGVTRDPKSLVHKPGPRIEDPRDPITSRKHRGAPAGVGAIGRHWLPRRNYTGTCDEHWMRERMPLLPLDFDERFNQVAPPPLIAPSYLRGGEQVQLMNLNARGAVQFRLPRKHFFIGAIIDGELREHRSALDTVLLEPNVNTFELTWRAAIPMPRKLKRCGAIQVHEKEAVS